MENFLESLLLMTQVQSFGKMLVSQEYQSLEEELLVLFLQLDYGLFVNYF